MFVQLRNWSAEEISGRLVYLEQSGRSRLAEWLTLVAEFDRRRCWMGSRFRSTADWLGFECRISPRTARDQVRVARRLASLPAVAERLLLGRLSYCQVRAITRAAGEADEAELIRVAERSTIQELERHVRQLRSAPSADLDTANAGHERRTLKWFWDEDGSLRFFGRLGADDGAALIESVETARERLDEPSHESVRPAVGAQRADALAEIARSGAPRMQLVLHADLDALACSAGVGEPRAGDLCALRDGPAIPSELARRLTCDCDVAVPGLNLGRTQRVISPAQRRALELRDGRVCAMPGCDRTHRLHGHHITHWIRGGRTDLDNLCLLCPQHHRLFHDEGFRMSRRRDGGLLMRDTRGRELHRLPQRASPGVLIAA